MLPTMELVEKSIFKHQKNRYNDKGTDKTVTIHNGKVWVIIMKSVFLPKDENGKTVHAHGGQIITADGVYYWIGENRTERNKVSCYKSEDLQNWQFCNHIFTVDAETKEHYVCTDLRMEIEGRNPSIGQDCKIERPKVIYNEKTKQYVMWMHWELPDDYTKARCAVAVCDTVDGDYIYLGSFNPIGHMSRDCTLFVDDDKTAYFISAARENEDLHIYKLSEDYLSIDKLVRILWPGQKREAPTMFKRNGYYYLLTSGCTGWDPNQSSYAYSKTIDGDWSMRYDLGDETTYRSQPTWVFTRQNTQTNECEYWYLGDRWHGGGVQYYDSEYVLLPLRFLSDTELKLDWMEEITLQ